LIEDPGENFDSWINFRILEINALNGEFNPSKIKRLEKLPTKEVHLMAYTNMHRQ
jgi:hypothetical protein